MSHSSVVLYKMDLLACHFNSEVIDSVRVGRRYRIVGDNINFQVGVKFERKGEKHKQMENWFGSAAVIQNIGFNRLPSHAPQRNIADMDWTEFLPSADDFKVLTKDYCRLVGRILVKFMPAFSPFKNVVNKPIKGELSDILTEKNKVVPLPALPKNEQKYSDVVDILYCYESVVMDVAGKARVDVEKVHIDGDQLTKKRFSGAKRLRACA